MAAISAHVIREFCALCDAAYQAGLVHRTFFDDNPEANRIGTSCLKDGYNKLSEITQEYALLQIAKLHDPAVVSGKITLSIAYVLTYGGWRPERQAELASLAEELDRFASKLRVARNQALSHNDLAAILAGGVLGAFEKNEDVLYFSKLQTFADIVCTEVCGCRFTYGTSVADPISAMASALGRAVDT